MRMNGLFALATAVMALGTLSPQSAQAFDHDRPEAPSGWVGVRHVRHWVYYPRYHHYYLTNGSTDPYADPYAYTPGNRGYYPYYNSGYWKARGDVALERPDYVHPTYYAGWGSNKKHWNQKEWHAKHHGLHERHEW